MCQLFIDANPALWESHTRSFRIEGMVTSVRLEARFWSTLEDIADRDGLSLPQLFQRLYRESVDAGHDIGNFASFLRVCCLRYLALQLDDLVPRDRRIAIQDLPASDILQAEHQAHEAQRNAWQDDKEKEAL
ncbi:ribbon-helix-helix domain-containing protein [Cognatishimia sp. SS12]|uniref:ribbon-helix-helix domain-containing protein n=1 Tax=Cognatishimia sp. SS12 TaxID=2979465 RepID=UPI00232FDBB5|nr:ribbon-helix-helix domain-containing protein [Cognatishimia sp. SS12]MDC0738183.1 ribbon-helix-helix domain-containing protein [Cognatishimia sp. SS12]